MGVRGPAPKPSDQRARNESKERKASTDFIVLERFPQPDPRHHWREEVVAWYQSLAHVERPASDWQYALVTGDLMEDAYATGHLATKWANIAKRETALGLTEADRRRNGVESKPTGESQTTAAVTQLRALKGGG